MVTALRTLDAPGTGPCYVDFRLGELRLIDNPSHCIDFVDLSEETKASVRGLRAEFGPNCFIPGLDD